MALQRCFVGLVLFVWLAWAGAAGLPAPTAEYSADRELISSHGTFMQKVYASGVKQRSETEMEGMKMVTIVRPDKQVAWTLMPVGNMYQEISLAQAQQQTGTPGDDVEITKLGSETVEGFDTTKYKMTMKDGHGDGFLWLTKDNIPVMMQMNSQEGGQRSTMTMTLKNLHIGPQNPALFELPPGYSRMPAMGMPGMGMPPSR